MLYGLGDARPEFGMHLALHPLGCTLLSCIPQRINSEGYRFASTCIARQMCVCKDAVLRHTKQDKPKSRTTLLWEQPLSWAHLIKGDLLVIPVLDVEEHHHPPVLVPAGQDARVAGLDGAAHGLGAQVVKELGVLLAEIHIAWREAKIGKNGCSPGLGKLGELPEMGWAGGGDGEVSVLNWRAVESSACMAHISSSKGGRSSAAHQPHHACCYSSPCQKLPTPAFSPTPQ